MEKKKRIEEEIFNCGIIPTVKIDRAEKAVELVNAVRKGGVNCIEITFRTVAAAESIRRIAKAFPDIILGAGTILTETQLKEAIVSGAKFIVSPGFGEQIAKECLKNNLAYYPGCCTPTEIENALSFGLNIIKFFPAQIYGGVKAIKAFSGPYNNVKFIPTGGISADNMGEYLKLKNVLAVGGTWMVNEELIKEERFEEVTQLCKDAREIAERIGR